MSSPSPVRPCGLCKKSDVVMSGVPCESCFTDWCMACEMRSPANYYTVLMPGEDPLDSEERWLCDKCVKKEKWRKRWTDPRYFLQK